MKRTSLFRLFIDFLKIGLFTFGGGYAMIPLMQRIVVEDEKWLTYGDMLDIIAIAEATPGPIALNVATFVGYRQRGILGAIFASFGLAVPSLAIIMTIAYFKDSFLNNRLIAAALSGMKVAIVVLIANALFKLAKLLPKNRLVYGLIGVIALALFLLDLNRTPISGIYVIVAGGLLGMLLYAIGHYVAKRGSRS